MKPRRKKRKLKKMNLCYEVNDTNFQGVTYEQGLHHNMTDLSS